MAVLKIVASYALLFAIVGVFVWHSSGRPNLLKRLRPSPDASNNSITSTTSKSRRRAKRAVVEKEKDDSSADAAPKASGVRLQETNKAPSKKRKINIGDMKPEIAIGSASGEETTFSNRDIAKEMASTRAGEQFAPSLQSQRDTMPIPVGLSTAASSTTGGDADDDMSPSNSPALRPANAGGVEDMLPPPVSSAGVLRITGEAPAPKTSRSTAKPSEPVETKKQRQARKKREEQKARNEEAERERLRLQEAQIRRARMAAGTSNEQKATAFKANQQNVWAARSQNGTASTPQRSNLADAPLLDTFDDSPATAPGADGISSSAGTKESVSSVSSMDESSGLSKAVINGSRNVVGSSDARSGQAGGWMENVPSEEEQMQQFKEQDQDSAWNTVPSKKKRKPKVAGEFVDGETNGSEPTMRSGNTGRPPFSQPLRPNVNASNSFVIPGRGSETEA